MGPMRWPSWLAGSSVRVTTASMERSIERCCQPISISRDNFHPMHSHVVPALLQRFHMAKVENLPFVEIWGSGDAKREFLFVDDLVEACLFLGDFPEELGQLKIGSKQEVSMRELAETVREVVDYSGELVFDTSKPDGMPLKKVDTSQLDQLGWYSTTSLQKGLEKTYAWYLQQLELPSSERRLRS